MSEFIKRLADVVEKAAEDQCEHGVLPGLDYERVVRAVIDAMREPTHALDRVVSRFVIEQANCDVVRLRGEEIWRAMIDEALV